ncbi:MAG: hypothetical protein AB7D41_03605 [Arcobacter sp.]|uniref:hypothetical protein n=1 Tax=Arcobacter sp. TaxID=1872629 RepID=UPI003CFF85CE
MPLLNLDNANREFIEFEIEKNGEIHILKLYKQNGKQKKAQREALKNENTRVFELEELIEKQFFERLKGDEAVIESIKEFYDENGDIGEFISECEKALGKQKKKA